MGLVRWGRTLQRAGLLETHTEMWTDWTQESGPWGVVRAGEGHWGAITILLAFISRLVRVDRPERRSKDRALAHSSGQRGEEAPANRGRAGAGSR